MDYAQRIHAAMVGGLAFDYVKSGIRLTASDIKFLARQESLDWLYDTDATDEILQQLNQLGYKKHESRSEYGHRLDGDPLLTALLISLAPKSSDKETAKDIVFRHTVSWSEDEPIIEFAPREGGVNGADVIRHFPIGQPVRRKPQ